MVSSDQEGFGSGVLTHFQDALNDGTWARTMLWPQTLNELGFDTGIARPLALNGAPGRQKATDCQSRLLLDGTVSACGSMAEPVGLGLQSPVLHHRDTSTVRVAHPALPLLYNMRQFVPEQLLALDGVRLKPSLSEIQIVPYRECHRTDPLGLRSHMHPHGGEIRAQRRLHLAAHRVRQRLAAAAHQPKTAWINLKRVAGSLRLHRC